MAVARLISAAIAARGMSHRQGARHYGVSKSWAHQLRQRFLLPSNVSLEKGPKPLNGDLLAYQNNSLWDADFTYENP